MKLATCLATAALLAGCSSLNAWSPKSWSLDSWSPGSWSLTSWTPGAWLDAKRADPPPPMSDEQAAALLQQATELRRESDALWARLAGERDRVQRFRYYDELRALGARLAPIERSLRDAGRPTRAAAGAAPAA
jgi:hypothetical protein